MSAPDILAPLEFSDLVAPQQIWGRSLFDHLVDRFDYILQFTESDAGLWSVSIWWEQEKARPGKLGIKGELGCPGWTTSDVQFGAAVRMAEDAIAILRQRGVKHVAVFKPNAGWLARVRALRSSASFASGGAA